jgi:hypothetical protein
MCKNWGTGSKINYHMDSHHLHSLHRLNSKHTLLTKKYCMVTHRITQTTQRLSTKNQSILWITLKSKVQTKIRKGKFSQLRASTRSIKITRAPKKSSQYPYINKITVHTKSKRRTFPQMHSSNVTFPTNNKAYLTSQTNPISRLDLPCITHQNWTQKFYSKTNTRLPKSLSISKIFKASFMVIQLWEKQCLRLQRREQTKSTRWRRRTLPMKK